MPEREKRPFPLSRGEIVSMVILTAIVYVGSVILLFRPMNECGPDWFFTPVGLFTVLGFDMAWFMIMKLWKVRNMHVKIILTVLVFTLSASVLTCWLLLNALSKIW